MPPEGENRLSGLQLAVMRVLWQSGEATVNEVHAELGQGQRLERFFLGEPDRLAVDRDFSVACGDVCVPPTMHSVKLQQQCELFDVAERLVDQDDLAPGTRIDRGRAAC